MNTSTNLAWRSCRAAVVTLILTCLSLISAWATPLSPDVVIAQVCPSSSVGSTYNQKFVVLFNRSATAKSIQGYTLQAASATGTSWAAAWTGGAGATIQGYGYYLISGSTTASGGVALPLAADATGTFNSSATAAKVGLFSSATGPGAIIDPQGAANIVDFIGYGATANAAEGGSANDATINSNTQEIQRLNGGCTDTDNNKLDFAVVTVAGALKNSTSTLNACGSSIQPETAADGSAGSAYAGTTMNVGGSVTLFTIVRDSGNAFFLNDTATWSLVNKTGNIVDGDLVAAGNGRSAVFTGNHTGTATIRVTAGSLTSVDSGTVTVQLGSPTQVRVETAADGSGTVVSGQTISQGGANLTVYAIERDGGNNFLTNTPDATWSLLSLSGAVVSGDLVPAGNNKSAVFHPNNVGSAVIDAAVGGLTSVDSGTINVSAIPPTFTSFTPASPVTSNANSTVTITGTFAGATGGYQWKHNAGNLTDVAAVANTSAAIAGSTTATLTLTGVFGADAGSYTLVATNNAGATTSSAFVLNVTDPLISTNPAAAVEVRAGHIPVLIGAATGTAPITYRWQKNGVNYPGATASTFSVPVTISDSGSYTLIATGYNGNSVTSSVSVVTVKTSTSQLSLTQNLTKGHLVVWRLGDGATSLTTSNHPLSIVEFDTTGSLVQAIPLPTTGDLALTVAGQAFGEGWISTTPDTNKLVIVGYNANALSVTNVAASTAANGRRSIATLDSAGNFSIQYTLTAGQASNIRGGTGDNSGNFWATLATGTCYMNTGVAVDAINSRGCYVMPDGNLWRSSASSGYWRAAILGSSDHHFGRDLDGYQYRRQPMGSVDEPGRQHHLYG